MNVKILTNKNWIRFDKQIVRWRSKGYRSAGITGYNGNNIFTKNYEGLR